MAPTLRIPVDQIADYSQVALEPLTVRYFTDRPDRLFNFSITARAAASYAGFEPRIPWERVTTPVLVTIGDEDRMVSRAHTERCLERAQPPRTTFMPHRRAWATSSTSTTWPPRCRRRWSGSNGRWPASRRRSR